MLTDDERGQLQRWTRRHTSAQALTLRSRIILTCAEGAPSRDVAVQLACNEATIEKWHRRFVADRLDGRTWKAFGLQPHRAEGFKLSTDPVFAEKVHDVVGSCLNPPEAAVVLCMDERSQVQAQAQGRSRPRSR